MYVCVHALGLARTIYIYIRCINSIFGRCVYVCVLGSTYIIYIRCMSSIFGREPTKHMAIYGVYGSGQP